VAIKEEFIHNFGGFWDTPSRCHVRILDDADKPLVVICSQMAKDPGTSVTNAAEDIAQQIKSYLSQNNLTLSAAIQRYIKSSRLTKKLDDLIRRLKDSKNLTVFTLESIKLALEYRERQLEQTGKINNIVWVEHYSKVIGYFDEDRYAIVSFESDTWTPKWAHFQAWKLAEITGYSIAEFEIPDEVIES